jgi:Calcineurin-like phosphoesterase
MPYLELLDRASVLANLESARGYLEQTETLDMGEEPPLTGEEIREVIAVISQSLENVDTIDAQDEPVYFSRDPIIGGFQMGVEESARTLEPLGREGFEAALSLEDYAALDEAPDLPVVTDERLPIEPDSELESFRFPGAGAVARFGGMLVRGGAIGVAIVHRAFKGGPRDFNPTPAKGTLETDARLYLTSDWASGEKRARWLASRITRRLQADSKPGRSHVLHLGDVYHAGRSSECTGNALDPWPVPAGTDLARSWALNGNHDMYSGGYGYFETLLRDARFEQQRSNGKPTSIFQLENEHWVVLGLDSAWTPDRLALATAGGLHEEQRGWIESSIREAEGSKKVILLSHHQLFSAFDRPEILEERLGEFLRDHPVHAWFWGHEHVCTLYRPRPEVAHARCVGNSGVSTLVKSVTEARQPELVELHFEGEYPTPLDGRPAQLFGFAQLEFSGPDLRVTYVDENDVEWHSESI